MDYYSAFPYYMGYQGYGQWSQPGMVPEDRILEDMEYLQQMYPAYSKRYQGIIKSVVDKMDYDGSFIYDQYPDKLTLQRMVSSVMSVIKANEEKENAKNGIQPMEDAIQIDMETGMPCSDTGNGVMIQNMDISDALTVPPLAKRLLSCRSPYPAAAEQPPLKPPHPILPDRYQIQSSNPSFYCPHKFCGVFP